MTHRFHPLFGQDFEFVAHHQNWDEDRVHLHDENGDLFSLPAGWTDVVPAGPFVVIADGRCSFTVDGLLTLADLIGRLRSLPADGERPLNSRTGWVSARLPVRAVSAALGRLHPVTTANVAVLHSDWFSWR